MENPFEDVFTTDYYYDAVLWAVKEGITNGTSATTFSPNAPCTRAQMVTFLCKYYTDQIWGESENYDLCINSSKIGVAGAVNVIKAYIENNK